MFFRKPSTSPFVPETPDRTTSLLRVQTRRTPPTAEQVREELGLPADVEVRVIPFTALGSSIQDAVRKLNAQRRVDPAPDHPAPDYPAPVTATETAREDLADELDAVTANAKEDLSPFEFREFERSKQVIDICFEVFQEVKRARSKHPVGAHSPHEGHSIIREELEKLWSHVKADTGRSPEARKEAIQVAAMAVRYILDLID